MAGGVEDALGTRGDPERGGLARVPGTDLLANAPCELAFVDAKPCERRSGEAGVGGQREQEVLGADIAMVEGACMALGGGDDRARVVVELGGSGDEALLRGLLGHAE